jgi:TPR repeat protein
MASAGDLNRELGRQAQADFWYESAAHAGYAVGMFNTGIAALNRGDRSSALQWMQRAAEAGNVEGYAALTQFADEAGDDAAELHWSRLGAEEGHLFCMGRYALLLGRDANGDIPTMRLARDYSEQAADRGDLDSAVRAVAINDQLGERERVQKYVSLVAEGGDAEAIDRLRRHGYL